MVTTLDLEPIDATFGAVVHGISLRHVDDDTTRAIEEAWLEHGLLIFHDQHLTPAEQDAFAQRFGDLEFTATPLTNIRRDGSLRTDPDHDLIKSLQEKSAANREKNERVSFGKRYR